MVYPTIYEENFDEVNMLLRQIAMDHYGEEKEDKRIFVGSGEDAHIAWSKACPQS